METKHYSVAIVGGGPAGLTAALYLGRAHVNTLVIDKNICGGQIISSPLLENVPGYYGSGADLAVKMLDEVQKYSSVEFENFNPVLEVHPSYSYNELDGYVLTLEDGTKITSEYLICATGSSPIMLKNVQGHNVHYCVTCDGVLYQNKPVAVIGGGNSALQYALELTKYASVVSVVTNEHTLRGEEYMRERVLINPKINVFTDFNVDSFDGKYLKSTKNEFLYTEGVFVAVGYKTNTSYCGFVSEPGPFTVDQFYRIYDGDLYLNNAFAIGDCRKKLFNQVVIAMADGCQVALQIIQDLEKQI